MELYQLKTFIVVADTGNLSRAADILHLSQPAISAQIKALENEFGITLFKRTSKGVLLTENGNRIRSKVNNILKSINELNYFLQDIKKQSHFILKIALNTDATVLKIKELLHTAMEYHPEIKFQFIQSTTVNIYNSIKNQDIDGGFYFGKQNNNCIDSVFLANVSLVIVGPFKWKPKISNTSIIDILKLPWVMPPYECPFYEKVSSLFKEYNIQPDKLLSSDNEMTTVQLIKSGMGVSLLPEYMCKQISQKHGLAIWNKKKFKIALCFAYLKRRKTDPLINTLLGILKKIWH